MSAHADDIRDAEILDLQRKVEELTRRVRDLEQRPIYFPRPCPQSSPPYPPAAPYAPWGVPYRKPYWEYRVTCANTTR